MLLNLRQHLFLSVALPLSLGLIVVTLAAIIPLYADVDDWNAQTSEAITSMVLGASATRLLKLHENLQVLYDQVGSDLVQLRLHTSLHLRREQAVSSYFRPYYGRATVDASTPRTEDSLHYPNGLSVASAAFLQGTTTYAAFTSTPYVRELGMVDPLLKAMYKANYVPMGSSSRTLTPVYQALMTGMESGLFRRYPYSRFPDSYNTGRVYCTSAQSSVGGFLPSCRPWYEQARAAYAAGGAVDLVAFGAPYSDDGTFGTVISASTPIMDPTSAATRPPLIGVLSIDLNILAVDDVVLSASLGARGYAFLMHSTGQLISHPELTSSHPVRDVRRQETQVDPKVWSAILSADPLAALGQLDSVLAPPEVGATSEEGQVSMVRVRATSGAELHLGYTRSASTGYVLVMLLPQAELDEADAASRTHLRDQLTPGTIALIIVLAFLLASLLTGTHYIARYYSRALKDAALVLQQAASPNLHVQLQMRPPVCREIDELFAQFQPLLVAINFANDKYYEGNLDKALSDYTMAEELMNRNKSETGMAKVLNNKGNVYLKQGQLDLALSHYDRAISLGEKLLRECEEKLADTNTRLQNLWNEQNAAPGQGAAAGAGAPGSNSQAAAQKQQQKKAGGVILVQPAHASGDVEMAVVAHNNKDETDAHDEDALLRKKQALQLERIRMLQTLGSRHSNLAVLHKQRAAAAGDANAHAQRSPHSSGAAASAAAYASLQRSLSYHQRADDDVGMARVASNLAQFYMEDGRLDEAQTLIQTTYAKLSSAEAGHAPDPASLQYATLTLGLLSHKQGKLEDAAGWLQYTLSLQAAHALVDSGVQKTCFARLEQVFKALHNAPMAARYRGLLSRQTIQKNVLFALDCSGSMAGGSIARCRSSIKEIISAHIEPDDRVSLITFSSVSRLVFPLTERGEADQAALSGFLQAVDSRTNPSGQTSFWDALSGGIAEFARVKAAAVASGDKAELERNNWLIALTDGEDNASRLSAQHVRRSLLAAPVHLIVITVGQAYDKAGIEMVLQAAKEQIMQAHHIQIGSDSIAQAFHSVAKIITQQLNVESMG